MPRPVRIGSDFAAGVIDFAVALGASPERLREAAEIDLSDLADPNRMIELEAIGVLMSAAAHDLADDAFGLHFGAQLEIGAMGSWA
jgi:hypothetical protein